MLRTTIDRRSIVDVTIRYVTTADTRNWESTRSCFTDDVVAAYDILGDKILHAATAVVESSSPESKC
jgi:hypothetical protein